MQADPMFRLPEETAHVDSLGDVLLRGLTFSGRVALNDAVTEDKGKFLAAMLSAVVQSPRLQADEWDVFGGLYQDDFLALAEIASRLAGLSAEDAEKKADSTDSP